MLRLSEAAAGRRYRVVRVSGSGPVRRRMMDMGILPGAVIRVLGRAPLGDPISVEVRGTMVTVRVSEASLVLVEEVKG